MEKRHAVCQRPHRCNSVIAGKGAVEHAEEAVTSNAPPVAEVEAASAVCIRKSCGDHRRSWARLYTWGGWRKKTRHHRMIAASSCASAVLLLLFLRLHRFFEGRSARAGQAFASLRADRGADRVRYQVETGYYSTRHSLRLQPPALEAGTRAAGQAKEGRILRQVELPRGSSYGFYVANGAGVSAATLTGDLAGLRGGGVLLRQSRPERARALYGASLPRGASSCLRDSSRDPPGRTSSGRGIFRGEVALIVADFSFGRCSRVRRACFHDSRSFRHHRARRAGEPRARLRARCRIVLACGTSRRRVLGVFRARCSASLRTRGGGTLLRFRTDRVCDVRLLRAAIAGCGDRLADATGACGRHVGRVAGGRSRL